VYYILRNPFELRQKLTKESEFHFKVNLFGQNRGDNLYFKKERDQNDKISPFLAEIF